MIEQRITLAKGGAASCPGGILRLGYEGNRKLYRLRIEQKDEWQGLSVRACWHIRGSDPPASLVENGTVEVPPQVTAHPGEGCVTFEGTNGERTVTSADVHFRVAPNSGVEEGNAPEPGTSAWEAFVKAIVDKMGGITGYLETYERTVPQESWTEETSGAFAWVCEVALTAAKASRVPSVVVLPEDFPAAKAAQIVPVCESGDGYIRLWAQEKPEQDLKVQISLYECSETGLGLCVLG